jgi:hypothetical protein
MNCNLGCYYCYESRSGDRLDNTDISGIIARVKEELSTSSALAYLPGALALYREPQGGEELVRLDVKGATELIRAGSINTSLSPGFSSSLLVVDADNIVDNGGDRLLRLMGQSETVIFTQELSQVKMLIEPSMGAFAWLDDGQEGTIFTRTPAGEVRQVSVGEVRLMSLTSLSGALYAIDQRRERLFRVVDSSKVETASLLDSGERPLAQFEFGFGGMWSVKDEIWLANANTVICVLPSRLRWSELESRRVKSLH